MRSVCMLLLCWLLARTSERTPLVDQFYRQRHQALFWYRPESDAASLKDAASLRMALMDCLDSAAWSGLDSNRYHIASLRVAPSMAGPARPDARTLMDWDRMYTDAAIALAKDLFQGADKDRMLAYDGVSPTFAAEDDRLILNGLGRINSAADLHRWMDGLEPRTAGYDSLKAALADHLAGPDASRSHSLRTALNAYRWIHHHVLPRYIVVNIPSATLRYFEKDSLILTMKVVAGQASKRTPRFAAWCNRIILYPYWNVPRKIAVNELLPLFKREPAMVKLMNMQLLDAQGDTVDPQSLPWPSYDKKNFPFSVRQATGCDNALGVVKFDINSPFDVYMHDTNLKSAFFSNYRYYSHGCIRLEKPLALGLQLVHDKLDTTLLRACVKDQRPFSLSLDKAVPVFVVYLRAEADTSGKINFYKDVYHLDP
ncbi:MAG: L,D-transpeptidase family protein [Bacteroidota bacterium]|nr:L,D-transpeptidase family protein [Bacteroidota bacterium]